MERSFHRPARPDPVPAQVRENFEVSPEHKACPGTLLAPLASGKANGFVLVYLALP